MITDSFKDSCHANESVEVDIDEAIIIGGSFGRYQKLVIFMVCFVEVAIGGQAIILYFVANDPPWTCVNRNTSSFCMQHFGENISQSSSLFKQRCKLSRSEWIFTKDKTYSIVTEYDLVCDDAWLASLANSALFMGWGLTGLPAGYLSDSYGRRILIISAVLLSSLSMLGSYFVNGIWELIILRAVLGAGDGYINANTIAKEVVGPQHRALAGAFKSFSAKISFLIIVPVAYYVQSWRHIMLYISLPAFVSAFISFFIPETARWLYASEKISKAEQKIQQITKLNKKCTKFIQLKVSGNAVDTKQYSYIDIFFRHFSITVVTLVISFIWIVQTLLYYGLTLQSSSFGGSIYTNFVLSCMMDLIAPWTSQHFANRFGRKRSFMGLIILSLLSVSTIAAFYTLPEKTKALETVKLVVALVGKFFVSNGFGLIYLWTFELFPTVVRSQGMMLCQIAGRIGSATAPFLARNLALVSKALPFTVMGASGLLSFFASFKLAETYGLRTREKFEDLFQKSSKHNASSRDEDTLIANERNTIDDLNEVTEKTLLVSAEKTL